MDLVKGLLIRHALSLAIPPRIALPHHLQAGIVLLREVEGEGQEAEDSSRPSVAQLVSMLLPSRMLMHLMH